MYLENILDVDPLFMSISADSVPSKRLRKALIVMYRQSSGKPASVGERKWMCMCHLPSDESDANCLFRCESPPSDARKVAFRCSCNFWDFTTPAKRCLPPPAKGASYLLPGCTDAAGGSATISGSSLGGTSCQAQPPATV